MWMRLPLGPGAPLSSYAIGEKCSTTLFVTITNNNIYTFIAGHVYLIRPVRKCVSDEALDSDKSRTCVSIANNKTIQQNNERALILFRLAWTLVANIVAVPMFRRCWRILDNIADVARALVCVCALRVHSIELSNCVISICWRRCWRCRCCCWYYFWCDARNEIRLLNCHYSHFSVQIWVGDFFQFRRQCVCVCAVQTTISKIESHPNGFSHFA